MKKVLLIGMLSILLTGCNLIINLGGLDFETSSSSKTSINTIITSGSYKNKGLTGTEYLEYYGEVTNCKYLPSIGLPKMLVVPVMFKGVSESSLLKNSSQILNDLEKTFNGNSEETGWESVSSYYKKTSYGKLDIQIDVLDEWITLDKTFSEISELSTVQYADPTWYVVDYVVNYLDSEGMDLKDYDTNSDGYIDGIWLVYGERNYSNINLPSEAQENLLWAYTYWQYYNVGNVLYPKANVYCWGSYDFMYESILANSNSKVKLDAHTFIHETGHMLGLDDYYDYDETSNPAGCLDMMDYNIGDHNAYSKYLLDWVEPNIFNFEEGLYTLEPFESSGNCLVIPSSQNNNLTPLDEYLIIEFYTPTGLNELDATYNYLKSYPKMFTINGIKIYHVDSRLGQLIYQQGEWTYGGYINNFNQDDLYDNTKQTKYFSIFNSNTPSFSSNKNYKLLTLLSDYYSQGYHYADSYAMNRDLFTENSILKGFRFNNGNSFDFDIEIESINNTSARIFIGER